MTFSSELNNEIQKCWSREQLKSCFRKYPLPESFSTQEIWGCFPRTNDEWCVVIIVYKKYALRISAIGFVSHTINTMLSQDLLGFIINSQNSSPLRIFYTDISGRDKLQKLLPTPDRNNVLTSPTLEIRTIRSKISNGIDREVFQWIWDLSKYWGNHVSIGYKTEEDFSALLTDWDTCVGLQLTLLELLLKCRGPEENLSPVERARLNSSHPWA